jgi:glycerol uptake facilitator-like aquaporin
MHIKGLEGGALIGIALGCGFATIVTSATLRPISGGHMNPAVTLAVVLLMKMPILKVSNFWRFFLKFANHKQGIAYLVCQVTGAILGAALVKGAIPEPGMFFSAHLF